MSDVPISFAQVRDGLVPSKRIMGEGFATEIPDIWRQGRTAYGGLTAGLALASAHRAFPDLPPLRSMLVNFTAPITGNPLFIPICLRRGKSVTTVQVTVHSEESVGAQIIFCFGGSRDTTLVVPGVPMVLDRSPLDYERFTPEVVENLVAKFTVNFETRFVSGSRPVTGAEEGYVRAVSRHRDTDSHNGIDCLVTIADILPPAALCMTRSMAPVSSVTWMLNMLTDQPMTEDGWWQVDTRLTAAGNGYSSQQMRVWALDGTPVADGMQSVAQFF